MIRISSYIPVKVSLLYISPVQNVFPDGGLVLNAPHIPVHLGSMERAVQFQLNHLGDNIDPGDVILSNHPIAGGSHLPDFTVITPVFDEKIKKLVFFVASRGHHADIGG